MDAPTYLIPSPIGRLLAGLPAYPGSVLFAHALNAVLRDLLPGDLQVLLHGKRVAIRVSDAQIAFHFAWDGRRFAACEAGASDLTISANTHDFLRLARRQEDPDTLFFSRRLLMEGDTELALAVKNMLDAIDTPLLQQAMLHPAAMANAIRKKIALKTGALRSATP